MSGIQQKFKLMKLYELLKQETDEDHPISRIIPPANVIAQYKEHINTIVKTIE